MEITIYFNDDDYIDYEVKVTKKLVEAYLKEIKETPREYFFENCLKSIKDSTDLDYEITWTDDDYIECIMDNFIEDDEDFEEFLKEDEYILDDASEQLADQKAYERDPLGYYGLSASDFC